MSSSNPNPRAFAALIDELRTSTDQRLLTELPHHLTHDPVQQGVVRRAQADYRTSVERLNDPLCTTILAGIYSKVIRWNLEHPVEASP